MKPTLLALVVTLIALGCKAEHEHEEGDHGHDHEQVNHGQYVRSTDEADKKAGIVTLTPDDKVKVDASVQTDAKGKKSVHGEFTNSSQNRLEALTVYVNIFDKEKKTLEVLEAKTEAVEPGTSWHFEVSPTKPGADTFAVVEIRARKAAAKG